MYKSLITTVKDLDETKGKIKVAANAIGNIDSDEQISMPGSFDKTIKENFGRLKWFLNHDRRILLGVPLEAKEANPYLEVVGQLNLKKEIARDTLEDYKLYAEYGKTLEHSIGVDAVKAETYQRNQPQKVFEWKWWEYSTLTSWGANSETPLLEIKSAKDYADAIQWLELKLRKGNFTDEKFLSIEKNLLELRSLVSEPGEPTHTTKPDETKAYVETIKQFIQSFN